MAEELSEACFVVIARKTISIRKDTTYLEACTGLKGCCSACCMVQGFLPRHDGPFGQDMGRWEWSRIATALLPVPFTSPCFTDKGKNTFPRKGLLLYPEAHDFPSLLCKIPSLLRKIVWICHIGPYSSGQETYRLSYKNFFWTLWTSESEN